MSAASRPRPLPGANLNTLGLEGKFTPPASQASQVHRTGLCDSMARAAGQLVLVRAPAGFGKTTAMLQARAQLEAQGVATAWLTLDRADNDASRFLNGLDATVRQIGQASGVTMQGTDVVQNLIRLDVPFALFLDEFEAIHEAALLNIVREIAHHLPRQGHLVMGSRSLPQIGLSRLRVRGLLTEIDSERLRFSVEDTAHFFAQRLTRHTLSAQQVQRLHDKTEGWVAALWLAAMALQRTSDPAEFIARFSGSDRAIADYLAEDVLAQQSPPVRRFLLCTSILRQLDVSVCQAISPRQDCAALLEQLDAGHLFLTPVAGEQRAWRYHSLFADFLRTQLQQEHPQDATRLHLAASGWYESQGRPVPAIDHAIEGEDFPHAIALLLQHVDSFLEQGRMRLLARWLGALPMPLLAQHARLQAALLWATSFTRGPWEAMDALAQQRALGPLAPPLDHDVRCMQPMLLAMQDRNDEALQLGREALTHLSGSQRFADCTLLNAMAHTLAVTGAPAQARQLLDAARQHHSGHSSFNRMYSESTEGLLDLQHGRLRQAGARFRLAVDATHAVNFHHTHGNAWAGVLYASVVYEGNHIEQAEHLLNVYLPLARDVGLPDHMILSHAMRARIAFIHGDVDAAWHALTELEYLGNQRKLPRVVAAAKLERARLLLLQGHAQAAHEELLRADQPEVWARERRQQLPAHDIEYLNLARLRWEVTFGDAAPAVLALEAEIRQAATGARQRRLLSLRLLQALALQRSGQPSAALGQLGEVLQTACQEGFMRLLLDEGPALGLLVQRYQTQQEGNAQRDPLMGEYLQRLLQAFGPLPVEVEKTAAAPCSLQEPLTRKEIRVLELLVEGYSNSAMAEKLYVSDSTVRTHLRNINAKLGAHNRTQAVAIARRLGVL
mgnify:FL=1